MKKQLSQNSFQITLLSKLSTSLKILKIGFKKTVEINNDCIKKNNPLITKTNTTNENVFSFTDSILQPETVNEKPRYISDCCPLKKSKTLDLIVSKKGRINFQFLQSLKTKNTIHRNIEESIS